MKDERYVIWNWGMDHYRCTFNERHKASLIRYGNYLRPAEAQTKLRISGPGGYKKFSIVLSHYFPAYAKAYS
jgi:hypothetical protein